jgi:outer membrane lipoprotein-sorting protein
MKNNWIRSLLLIAGIGIAFGAMAETPEEKGLAIAQEGDRRNEGFVDNQATMLMILKDRQGKSSEREMRVQALEGPSEVGDKTLIVFDTPKDQRGTALLTWQYKDKDDDQWLYLPALKRVRKIASSNRSGPFMGSEFSFEDLGGQQVEKYTYKWLRDEPFEGQDCFVVESYPKDENSGYTRMVSWIDKEHYRTLKVEFYDRKQSHLKTLSTEGWKQYEGKFWRADKLSMENLQTGKSTEMINKEIKFKSGLADDDFTTNSLMRTR